MHRRHVLSRMSAAAALTFTGIQTAATQPRPNLVVLRLGFTGNLSTTIGSGAVAFARRVQDSCDGRLRVDLCPAGEAGGEVEMVQDVAAGVLDMVYTSSAGYASVAPSLGIFDIPFLFRDVAHARAVLDGRIGATTLTCLDRTGIAGLAWGENGLRHVTTADRAVRRAADLIGLKLRVPQSPVMVTGFRAMGADAQPLPFPALYAALASGQFQGQENPLRTIRDSRFDRVQRFVCLTGHVYSPGLFMIGRSVLDRLAGEDAQALRQAASAGAQASRANSDVSDKTIVKELRQLGMTVVEDVDRQSFTVALAGVQKDYAAQFGAPQIAAIQHEGL